ncbi:helix-turn-helix transcriptional regulator [Streptomyces sp. NPDC046860]|uniref:helix-turn-helix domain-containing protein n=1 Tax=Streptomyces sp. NPDC046860 TaxID=3154495 RepID=UPI0033E52ED6
MSTDPIPIIRPARPLAGPETTKTAAGIMLGLMVKQRREALGLKQNQLAKDVAVSNSKICRLENADGPPERRMVHDVIKQLRFDDAGREVMMMLLARALEPEWFQHRFNDITPDYLKRLLGLESMALSLTAYDVRLVTGLLQTPKYASRILQSGLHLNEQDGEEMELRLAQRLERQSRVLGQAEPPRCVFLMDESVLMRRVGDDDVMHGQMVHLREYADHPYVTIRFVMLDRLIAGNAASMAGSMAELQFGRDGLPDMVYSEGYEKADYHTRPSSVSDRLGARLTRKQNDYERHLQLLLRIQGEACASPAESRHLLDAAIKRYAP